MKGKVFSKILLLVVLSLAITGVAQAQDEKPAGHPSLDVKMEKPHGHADGAGLVVRVFPLIRPLQDHDPGQNGWMTGRNPTPITGREGYPLPVAFDGGDIDPFFFGGQRGQEAQPRGDGLSRHGSSASFSKVSGLNISCAGDTGGGSSMANVGTVGHLKRWR